MKNLVIAVLFIGLSFSCKKEETVVTPTTPKKDDPTVVDPGTNTTFNTDGQTLLVKGALMGSGNYTVSGDVKIYEDKNKKRTIVFDNLKSSSGPDIKMYLSEDSKNTGAILLNDKVVAGHTYYELPANTDIAKKKFAIIWCKQYSVLFGSGRVEVEMYFSNS